MMTSTLVIKEHKQLKKTIYVFGVSDLDLSRRVLKIKGMSVCTKRLRSEKKIDCITLKFYIYGVEEFLDSNSHFTPANSNRA